MSAGALFLAPLAARATESPSLPASRVPAPLGAGLEKLDITRLPPGGTKS